MVQPLQRTAQWFLKKLKLELTYDTEILPLSRYPEKIMVREDACNPVFTATIK